MNTPNKMPKQDIEGWEQELKVEVMENYIITAELGHLAKDQAKHKEEMRFHYENLKSFIRQKLTLVREEALREASVGLEKMTIKNPKCDCKTHLEHNCDFTSNEAISDALSHLKQLKQK